MVSEYEKVFFFPPSRGREGISFGGREEKAWIVMCCAEGRAEGRGGFCFCVDGLIHR